jgi:tetratricopeptide (TPR) repeat protein
MASYLVCFVLFTIIPQSPRDTIRQHYEAAEANRKAGNLAGAEKEFSAILAEAYGRVGRIYSARKAYKDAAEVLGTASAYQPDAPEILVDLAIARFNLEQFDKALVPLQKVLGSDPRNVAAHHMLGKTYFMTGELAKAADELRLALKFAPGDNDVSYTLGLVYLKQRQLAPAKQIYDQILRRVGERPQLHILFGRAYRETGFLEEAVEELKRAIALDPKFPRSHYYLGLTYLLKDGSAKLDEATKEFQVELSGHPEEFFANYYLGVIYNMQRKWTDSIPLLQAAAKGQPRNPDPYFYLGEAYQGIGKHDKAIDALRKAIEFNPSLDHNEYQVSSAHYRLAQSLLATGQRQEGEKELQVSLELKVQGHKRDEEKTTTFLNSSDLHPQNGNFAEILSVEGTIAEPPELDAKTGKTLSQSEAYYTKVIASAHNNIGLLRAQREDYKGAIKEFATAARWNPDLPEVNFNLGLASYKAEMFRQAIEPFENEIKTNPPNLAARQLLGMSYFMVDDYSKAADLLGEVTKTKTGDAGLYYTLAVCLIKQGKNEAADLVIQKMVAMNDGSPQLHILMGQAYYEQGDTNKSLEELKAAIASDNKIRLAHYYTGLIQLKLGKLDEAAREFQQELVINPSDFQAKYHLAFVLLASQKREAGIRLIREVIQQKPDYAEAHYELGKALLLEHKFKEAIENLEVAVRLKPDESYLHYQLGRAYLEAGRTTEGEKEIELSKTLKDKARSQASQ